MLYSQDVHSWLAQQGYEFFRDQFGQSELESYQSQFRDGAYDEDTLGRNPFGQDTLEEHPSLEHFWTHDVMYQREFDNGLLDAGSAPNKAIEYMTGGIGINGVFDPTRF